MKLKVVLIGLGAWGNNFIRLIQSNNHLFELVATVEPKSNGINNIKNFSDLNELINSNVIFDAAIITTPTATHYDLVLELLKIRKHCLVEKPITTNLKEAIKLYDFALKNKLEILVDHTFLYDPSMTYIKNIISKKALGELLHISFERTNFGPIRYDVSAIWDLATHDISILSALFEFLPTDINSTGLATINKNLPDVVNTSMFYGDIFVSLTTSWLHPEKSRKIKIVGTKKMLIWDSMSNENEIKIFDKTLKNDSNSKYDLFTNIKYASNGKIVSPHIKKEEPLNNVLIDFYNRIAGNSSNLINTKSLTLLVLIL